MKIPKFLFSLLVGSLSCNTAQTNNTLLDTTDKNMTSNNSFEEPRKYADSVYYKKVPILLEKLKKNGYKFPDKNIFKLSILKIFNIHIDTAKSDYILAKSCQDANLNFVIFWKDRFVLYENFDSTSIKNLEAKSLRIKDMFFQFNNFLFNNTSEARLLLIQNKPKALTDLLFTFGYPVEDSLIMNAYFKDRNIDSYEKSEWAKLFSIEDNCNDSKISGLKEKVIDLIAYHYRDAFDAGAQAILYPEKLDEKKDGIYPIGFISQDIKYKCWAYILNTYEKLNIDGELDAFFYENKSVFKIFKSHKYYGLKELEVYCKIAETLTSEQLFSGRAND